MSAALVGRPLVLASGSPRRLRLLHSVGLDPEVRPAGVDEAVHAGEAPDDYVRRLAAAKAAAVVQDGELVLAADTTVEIDGEILGKPTGDADLRRMLTLLSGATHRVHTGVNVIGPSGVTGAVVTSSVSFVDLDDELVEWYVERRESADKAGGYALQGAGGALVSRVEGSVSNVVGLPLAEALALLRRAAGPDAVR